MKRAGAVRVAEQSGGGAGGPGLDLPGWAALLQLLGDSNRVRLLALLGQEELSVAELVQATGLPQPRVSTHLGKLREAGLVRDRKAGVTSFYALRDPLPQGAEALWELLRDTADDALLEQDARRMRARVAARGQSWADSVAGQMERHYSPGRTWEAYLRGLLGLARFGDVLDVASGDGAIAELIAPHARSVTCVDRSARVVAAGQARLQHLPGVRFQRADMHALPFADQRFDQVLLMNALTYSRDPRGVLAEARRVLRPGGALTAVTLRAHRHAAEAARYDHCQLGFAPEQLRAWLQELGLRVSLCDATARERQPPHFEVLTVHAGRPAEDQ